FITCRDEIHSRGATAQRHQPGIQPHLVKVIQIQIAIAQPNPRKHRVVLTVDAVSGDMKQASLRTLFAKNRRGCTVSHMERSFWKERRYGLGFLQDLGRSLVGDSKNEGIFARARRLFLAPGKNRRTGSVGNCVGITEVLFSISQSVERQEMKRAVGHENEVLSLEIGA